MDNPFEEILKELRDIKEMLSIASEVNPKEEMEIINRPERPELVKRLGITEPTAIRWEKRGKIPVIRFGSNVRYNWPLVIESLQKPVK